MQIETWLKTDLQKGVDVTPLRGNLFSGDSQSNLIGVEVYDNGQAVTLSGSVQGFFIRGDGATVTIANGTLNGNKASVILPSSCYAIIGPVSIAIKVGGTTVGACHGYVYRTSTDAIVDPDHVIPSLSELLAQIEACQNATTAANTAATNANTKAGLADTAATNANNKATAANNAATLANNAATYANNAGAKINNMTVSATGLAAGASPTAAVSDVDGHKNIAFGIPKGDTGATPNMTIGTVTTLGEDDNATANFTGTAENPVLNLGIPRGHTGSASGVYASNTPMSASDSTTISAKISSIETGLANAVALVVSISNLTSLPQTISNASITADMVVVNSVLSNQVAQMCDWTVTAANGSLTIAKSGTGTGIGYGGTDITLYLAHTGSNTAQTSTIKQIYATSKAGLYYSRAFETTDASSIFASNVSSGRIQVYKSGQNISIRLLTYTFNSQLTAGTGYTIATLPDNCKIMLMQQSFFISENGQYHGLINVTAGTGEVNITPQGANIPAGTSISLFMPLFNVSRDHDDQDVTGFTLVTPS